MKNNPNQSRWITRKEICFLVERSYTTLRISEVLWGIDKFKVQIGEGNVRYREPDTTNQLRKMGLIR